MADHDDGSKLETAVDAILAKKELETFAEYWNLAKELIKGVPVRACYARTDGSYVNVAILTDNLVFDIENSTSGATLDGVAVAPINSISTVYFHAGSVQTIPDSEAAQLTVVALRSGAADPGPYWLAKTDSEREDLIHFGRALLNAVNAS